MLALFQILFEKQVWRSCVLATRVRPQTIEREQREHPSPKILFLRAPRVVSGSSSCHLSQAATSSPDDFFCVFTIHSPPFNFKNIKQTWGEDKNPKLKFFFFFFLSELIEVSVESIFNMNWFWKFDTINETSAERIFYIKDR